MQRVGPVVERLRSVSIHRTVDEAVDDPMIEAAIGSVGDPGLVPAHVLPVDSVPAYPDVDVHLLRLAVVERKERHVEVPDLLYPLHSVALVFRMLPGRRPDVAPVPVHAVPRGHASQVPRDRPLVVVAHQPPPHGRRMRREVQHQLTCPLVVKHGPQVVVGVVQRFQLRVMPHEGPFRGEVPDPIRVRDHEIHPPEEEHVFGLGGVDHGGGPEIGHPARPEVPQSTETAPRLHVAPAGNDLQDVVGPGPLELHQAQIRLGPTHAVIWRRPATGGGD